MISRPGGQAPCGTLWHLVAPWVYACYTDNMQGPTRPMLLPGSVAPLLPRHVGFGLGCNLLPNCDLLPGALCHEPARRAGNQ